MPNWVEGKLKIRGDKKDMATFFKEEMREVEYQNVPVTNSIKIDIDKDGDFVVEKIYFTHRFKLKNARHYKIYAFEQGKEFNQNLEVVKGEIIKDEVIEFDDYVWECIDPTIGG